MTDRDALLAGIAARPADDLPRLVFADWLDDAGDADRAEFIRVQCELAAGGVPADRVRLLVRREAELLARNEGRWRVRGLTGLQRFVRGFVDGIETTAESLLATDPAELAGVPVRQFRLVNADRRVEELARLPVWRTVETLVLNNNTYGTGGRLRRFFDAAAMPLLTALVLRNNQVWPDGVRELAATPVAPRLKKLDLSGNPVGDHGADVLATHPAFAALEDLALRSDETPHYDCLHAGWGTAFARSTTLTRLTTLNLAGQYLGDAGLIPLAASKNVRHLTDLDLSYNDLGSDAGTGIRDLTSSPHLGRLRYLNLAGSVLDPRAVDALARWPRAAHLDRLDLRDCDLELADRRRLAALPWARAVVWADEGE